MNFFRKLICSNSGVSSKRFIGLTASMVVYIIAFVDLFTDLSVSSYVFEGLIWLAIGGIFGVAAEKFAGLTNAKSEQNTTPKAPPEEKPE